MCQVRAHVHQPCGCKSHQLRVCRSYKTQDHIPINANSSNITATNNTNTNVNTNINTTTSGSSSSYINLRTIPRFITICSKAFNPDIFSACPSYNMHPEVIDPHPCSDHWTMLSDVRLFFGPPRGLESGNDEGGGAVMTEDEGGGGGGGGQRWQWSPYDIVGDGSCPDPLRKDHLDSLRERYCRVMSGDENGKIGGGGDGDGDGDGSENDVGAGVGAGVCAGVCRQHQSQMGPEGGPSCKCPGVTKAKGGWTFLDMFLDWMGS
ncbi:hypothetical protein EMCG_03158 [[Emmonsia] crescens]|uniref:Uncharacterized protein n=1 Tax=[Emmonsia] crescens TaxID=73230 RepID=A0A0G2HWH4_9EURO|nr:hypothetical protein EMCG_03158 [Emmonsia crescens UAMH 3008]